MVFELIPRGLITARAAIRQRAEREKIVVINNTSFKVAVGFVTDLLRDAKTTGRTCNNRTEFLGSAEGLIHVDHT